MGIILLNGMLKINLNLIFSSISFLYIILLFHWFEKHYFSEYQYSQGAIEITQVYCIQNSQEKMISYIFKKSTSIKYVTFLLNACINDARADTSSWKYLTLKDPVLF